MALNILQPLDPTLPLTFFEPVKKINDGDDVQHWLRSKAYSDIMTFLLQLNHAMFPPKSHPSAERSLDTSNSSIVAGLRQLLRTLEDLITEAPPDPGPRRFGNISFRKWYELVESRVNALLSEHVPSSVFNFPRTAGSESLPMDELQKYLLGSFGSAQRLDFGTGHELSFLAFLAGLWKLGAFSTNSPENIDRELVLGVIDPYLDLVRSLIKTYNLEPAGSHGVWGLDDHSFLPYIFGSAQLSAALSDRGAIPAEGSASDAPKTKDVVNRKVVDEWRSKNMYFAAIGFIYDVKKGPFWEHSPMLYDISGVPAGWAKINKVPSAPLHSHHLRLN
jgi:serine/threonine-protein phosphatase 2A activator